MPQQTQTKCSCSTIEVIEQDNEPTIEVIKCQDCDCQIVEVFIQGERGAKGDSFNDTPFDFDPVEIYLNAKLGEL